jgi:hypothetical protein
VREGHCLRDAAELIHWRSHLGSDPLLSGVGDAIYGAVCDFGPMNRSKSWPINLAACTYLWMCNAPGLSEGDVTCLMCTVEMAL